MVSWRVCVGVVRFVGVSCVFYDRIYLVGFGHEGG